MVKPEIYTVSLGQLFHPFEIESTEWTDVWRWPDVWRKAYNDDPGLFRQADLFFILNLTTDTLLGEAAGVVNNLYHPTGHYYPTDFSPFESKFGYKVDKRDFIVETRKGKLKRLQKKIEKLSREGSKGSLATINFWSNIIYMLPDNRTEEIQDWPYCPSNVPVAVRDYLCRLRCQVFVAGQAYEAMPRYDDFVSHYGGVYFEGVRLSFNTFYPLDTGPLALAERFEHYARVGQDLVLPADPEKLASVEMRFTLRDNHLGGV